MTNEVLTDLVGHAGYCLILVGLILVAYKKPSGWLCRLAGEAVWVAIGLSIGMSSIWSWGAVFMVLDFSAYRYWVRNG